MLLIVSRLDAHFSFEHLRARAGAQVKLRPRKVWHLERILPTTEQYDKRKYIFFSRGKNVYIFGDSLYH